jgi:O-antigen/teichoic acid export membrane protein
LNKIILSILNFFNKGNSRSVRLKKNIGISFIIKGLSILLGLIKVPILLSYLDSEKYGVWLTIASIIMWVQHFDLGLGHGLRNKFAESLAKNDTHKAIGLVSTAYFSMAGLMLVLLLILLPIVSILNWNEILNVSTISGVELKKTVIIVLVMFVIRFVFQLITVVLKADQRPAISDMFLPIASFVSLFLIFIVKFFVNDSLFWASTIMAVPPVLVLMIGNIYFFKKDYKTYSPSIRHYKSVYLKDIYSLGLKFFVAQVLSLIMFSSSNLILSKIVNPQEVTIYNIARTYFNLPLTFFMIILTPYWSAITEAFVKNDFEWIKTNMNKLKIIALLFTLGLILMLIFSKIAFKFWVGDKVLIPFYLSIAFTIYNIIVLFLSPYNFFLNGVGKLDLGLRVAIFKITAFLPLAILLVNFYGAIGLVVTLVIVNSLPNLIFNTLQYKKIINRTAKGIWNK